MKLSKETTQETMSFLNGPSGKIQIYALNNGKAKKEQILILPNGYGVLEYCKSLGGALSGQWSDIFMPNLRGQGLSDGELSIKGGSEDVKFVCKEIRSIHDGKITIIVHCSAMLYLLNLVHEKKFWLNIERVILYAYLACPVIHIDRFKRKTKKYGVRVKFNEKELWHSNSFKYRDIPVPFFVVHPLNKINLTRANKTQLNELNKYSNPCKILTPKKGYEILDIWQDHSVSNIVTNYYSPIIDGSMN